MKKIIGLLLVFMLSIYGAGYAGDFTDNYSVERINKLKVGSAPYNTWEAFQDIRTHIAAVEAGTASSSITCTSITLGGSTITGWGSVTSPFEDVAGTITDVGYSDVFSLVGSTGILTCTGFSAGASDIALVNGQTIDGGTNNSVIFGDNSDTLAVGFDGDDVSLTCNDGSIELIPQTSAADGTVDIMAGGDTNDYVEFILSATDEPSINFNGCDGIITASGGDISFGNENLVTTGTASFGATTVTSIAGVDTITGDTNGDSLSFAVDDELSFTSEDNNSTIAAIGYESKDGIFAIKSDQSDDPGDDWLIKALAANNNFVIYNDASGSDVAKFTIASTNAFVTLAGDRVTLGDGEYIDNSTDDTVKIASNDASAILEVYSPNTSDGTASLIFTTDAGTDAGDRTRIQADGNENLVISNDTATADTFVTKFTIAGADGDVTTTGDVEIADDMDLILGTGSDWKIQYDEGVDNQLLFITANTSAIATTDPMFEILLGATCTANQEVFGISRGTQASNTNIFYVDEDGDSYQLGGATITADLTVNGGDLTLPSATASKPVLWLENTADDATGPSIILENDRATESDGDDLGTIIARASDSGDATFDAVTILFEANDITAGAECGKVTIDVEIDDTATEMLSMYGTAASSSGGIYFNQDEADVDFAISGNTTAGYFTIDSTVESTTLTSAITNMPLLHLENTTDDATCPVIRLENDRATEADGDDLGRISWYGSDGGDAASEFVYILAEANEIDATDEAGKLTIGMEINDTAAAFLTMFGDASDVDTGHFEINAGTVDIDTHIDSNDQADIVLVDAGSNDVSIIRNIAAANTDDALLTIKNDNVADDQETVSIISDVNATGDAPTVVIQSTSAAIDQPSLFINHDGTAGATTIPAFLVDAELTTSAAAVFKSPSTAGGTDAYQDDTVVAIVGEGVGGALNISRNVASATEPVLTVTDIHVDSTGKLASFVYAGDATADDDAITIQSSSAAYDKTTLFIDIDCAAGTTTEPGVEIDSEQISAAALLIKAPNDASGTDADIDDFVVAISAEGVGGGLNIHRDVAASTEELLRVDDDHVDGTSPLAIFQTDQDASADDAAVQIITTSAAHDQPALSITQAGTGNALEIVSGTSDFGGAVLADTGFKTGVVAVTDAATYSITAANSGKMHYIPNLTQNCTIALPAEAAGLNYVIVYAGGDTDAEDFVLDSENDTNYFIGGVSMMDTDDGSVTASYSDNDSNSKLTIDKPAGGTIIYLYCNGTQWVVSGTIVSATDAAAAFSDQP